MLSDYPASCKGWLRRNYLHPQPMVWVSMQNPAGKLPHLGATWAVAGATNRAGAWARAS